jgi:hypothetical protein
MDTTLASQERNHALRFIVHFLGDIHQPLHNEATAVGGNQINVTFDGKATNLHAAWSVTLKSRNSISLTTMLPSTVIFWID